MTDLHDERPRFDLRKAGLAGGLAILGGFVGFGFAELTEGRFTSWADEVAAVIAVVLLATGLASVGALLLRPKSVPSGCGWFQVASLMLAGAMLLLPMLAPADWPREAVFAAVLGLLLLQLGANLALWRISDELLRRVVVETGAACFWSLQLALFAYAAAERLGLVSTISAWGLIAIMMSVYVLVSSVVAFRRGLS